MAVSSRPSRIPTFFIYALVFLGLWLLFGRQAPPPRNPDATPRLVTPRGDLAADEKSTIELFELNAPAVVYITTSELRRDFLSLNVYEIPRGTGSGFIWDRDGNIVTNFHVIESANRVEVGLSDGSTWKAVVVGAAPDKDIAVLHIAAPKDKLRPVVIGESKDLLVGQKVFAIGNPFGLDHTLTAGIVSALGREIEAITGRRIKGVIQTDAAINPGNSGGPLLDSAGRLVGVNTAIYSPAGQSAGIGFAVPVEIVNRVVTDILRYGKDIRPGLGVTLANPSITRRLNVDGLLIINVQPGSGADKAGLRGTRREFGEIVLGDIIVSINGAAVESVDDLLDQLDKHQVGDEVRVGIIRHGRPMEVPVVLDEVD